MSRYQARHQAVATGPVRGVGIRAGRVVQAGQDNYRDRPLAVCAVLFLVLAVVRIAGAFEPSLMVVSIALTPLVLIVVPRDAYRRIGLCAPGPPRRLAGWCAVVLVTYAVTVGAVTLAVGTGSANWAGGIITIFDSAVPEGTAGRGVLLVAYIVVVLGVLVPAAEEVCYRGVLLAPVADRFGPAVAVVATSLAWTVVHLGDYGLVPLNAEVITGMLPSVFLMGLALGWCRVATGSVVASTVAQGVGNVALAFWVLQW